LPSGEKARGLLQYPAVASGSGMLAVLMSRRSVTSRWARAQVASRLPSGDSAGWSAATGSLKNPEGRGACKGVTVLSSDWRTYSQLFERWAQTSRLVPPVATASGGEKSSTETKMVADWPGSSLLIWA
jgi:hypothetical protein